MPEYIYKHPEREEYIELIQSVNDEHVFHDEALNNIEYKNHYLLKINHKNYFKKAGEANVRILYE